ncbi:N-acetylglucosamine-1-phosphodiester alpha-N-acetylglucosaminidase isoform X2 [Cuculus canorus]|uniref:N-acetylglucosamine-1-phosphodiester alpha-N-acetylglucosaminidase isoform X2 n=1 Tax=Cuculus canorus TaxID=55661 RepID=UPI0023AB0CE2|nr:N-acetylglucosamine-1-phosphodiester alpha-N-acetylglucosaminidase isoform X2 [Cuculus canorus]
MEWFVLKGPQSPSSPTPCHGQGHLTLDQSPIQPGLEHLQGRGSHHCSGQPGPGPPHPHSKTFLPKISSPSLLFQLKVIPLIPSLHSLIQSPSPAFLEPLSVPEAALKPPQSLLFSRLNNPNSRSLLVWEVLQPSDHLHGLLWTRSNSSVSFLFRGLQNWTQGSRWGAHKSRAEGQHPLLHLLVPLLWMQRRTRVRPLPAHVELLLPQHPKPFLSGLSRPVPRPARPRALAVPAPPPGALLPPKMAARPLRGGARRPGPGLAGRAALAALAALAWLQAARAAGPTASLQPYPPSRHGPRHPHRHVRDCQPLHYGNATHEAWPGDTTGSGPVATTRTFVSYLPLHGQDRRAVYGHFTFVRDPLRTLSVLEPGGAGGCQQHRRAPVEQTARLRGCLVAQNGGYFDMETGECLGNVVSDGTLVKNSGGLQNAQFGIQKDGTMVFGYLSEEDVLDQANPFVQLVSGVVWLLRDGEVYVNHSRTAECDEIQTTGTFDRFINVISARTAVGHDRQGRLVLVHVDGQTESRGVTLWEMAEFLKQQGIVNAINLDGGGSATLVLNGTLASYPSEHCSFDNMWRCPRSISTILCVHEPACEPVDCNGHGDCIDGECHCTGSFWSGPACDVLDCGPANCSQHGVCTSAGCFCDAGWMGSNCSEACVSGFYGAACTQKCQCQNGGLCDPMHGACSCPAGYYGTSCEHECPMGWYGTGCQNQCACEHLCPCDRRTGSCNTSADAAVQEQLNTAGQCLASQNKGRNEDKFSLSQNTWIFLTSVLALLLVLSAMGNIGFFLQARLVQRRRSGSYLYEPLRELNGEATHTFTAAACEAEDVQHQSQALIQSPG